MSWQRFVSWVRRVIRRDKDCRKAVEPVFEKPSSLESLADSTPVKAFWAFGCVVDGGVLGPIGQFLTGSLAGRLKTKRLNEFYRRVSEHMTKSPEKMNNLSESQFKIVQESLAAALYTIEEAKLDYLKMAIFTNIDNETVPPPFASAVSRALRDISVKELKFLIEHRKVERFQFIADASPHAAGIKTQDSGKENILEVRLDSQEGESLSGLMGLGICVTASSSIDDIGRPQYSPLAQRILAALGM